jgi:DNA-binding PadR family transcriptional regulator
LEYPVNVRDRLSPTSYAILGLLAVRPYSAYELAAQMRRSFVYIWPRAVSGIYEEPKRLVAAGYATAATEHRAGRKRTVYTVTEDGRAAFRRWLAEPSQPPSFESEALVRVMFAEQGDREDLLATLRGALDHARALQARLVEQAAGYADGGPSPRRLHVIALGGRFLHEYAETLERWAAWALQEVEEWPSTGAENAPRGAGIIAELRTRYDRA